MLIGRLERPEDRRQDQQPDDRVPDRVEPAGPGRRQAPVVIAGGGRPRRRAVPAAAGGHALTRMQGGGVTELGAVPDRGVDVEHRTLTDERVPTQG